MLRLRSTLRCRTLGRSRPRLAGLVPRMGKASVSNTSVSLGSSSSKSLGYGPFVGCGELARDPSSIHLPVLLPGIVTAAFPSALWLASYCSSPAGSLLLLSGWHPTGHHRWLASPLPGRSARPPTSVPPAIYSTVENLA